jgi:hypothetical protein
MHAIALRAVALCAAARARLLARAVIVIVSLAACLSPHRAASQETSSPIQPELRADVLVARSAAMQLGVGAAVPAGEYLRLGGDLGAGATGGSRGPFFSTRADLYGRFHLDPRAESRWAPYLVAGGSFRADEGSRGRLYALAAVGAEGPASHPIVPAFELGFGGGVRASVVLRRGLMARR